MLKMTHWLISPFARVILSVRCQWHPLNIIVGYKLYNRSWWKSYALNFLSTLCANLSFNEPDSNHNIDGIQCSCRPEKQIVSTRCLNLSQQQLEFGIQLLLPIIPFGSFNTGEVFLARSTTGPTEEGVFLQTAKGRAVLQQVKDFMEQKVLPAQKVSAESCQKEKRDLFEMKGFDRAQQFIHAIRTHSLERENKKSIDYVNGQWTSPLARHHSGVNAVQQRWHCKSCAV